MRNLILLILIFFSLRKNCTADVIPKSYIAHSTSAKINIDGVINDAAWDSASVATDFTQLDPVEGAKVSQQTIVKVLYDNTAMYVAAKMYDSDPDSILHQLGNRDEGNDLNADLFKVGIDPYNKRQEGYVFSVGASGVQTEALNDDLTFDAIWESAVKLNEDGWSVEMKIPYSALRFPAAVNQVWAVQFARLIRRNREYDQWTLTPKNVQNRIRYWGTMTGMKNIQPPLRLSLTPYLSVYGERSPSYDEFGKQGYQNSSSYSGGADLKYGIDERFTLDVTLLPDFSQVQSDDKVKNLSAFETIYEERRPFFKEGTALFAKGNLFYSRRIGRTPELFYSVADSVSEGELLVKNPDKAKLLNATKLSGRTDKGLGIGLLNAVTNNTYAEIKTVDGKIRRVLTDPLSNYNLVIFDQQLKNNCDIFIVNTNVIREGKSRDANVTTLQGTFENNKHQIRISGAASNSDVYTWEPDENGILEKQDKNGKVYSFTSEKISGKSYYGVTYEICTGNYDKNDLSYIFYTDYTQLNLYYVYNFFNPFLKYFKQGNINFNINRGGKISDNNNTRSLQFGTSHFFLFNNNWSVYNDFYFQPDKGRDYEEPRVPGRVFRSASYTSGSTNWTTNYNKRLAFDFGGRFYRSGSYDITGLGYYISPMVRISDHLNVKFSHNYDMYRDDIGYAFIQNDSIYFARRNVTTIVNSLTTRYLFKNDMSLSVVARHYWSKGVNEEFMNLLPSGELNDETVKGISGYDFTSNYFTLDLVYNWQFAPGSSFLITYKNEIISDSDHDTDAKYFTSFSDSFTNPQKNSLSLKVLYYLDYQYLVKRKA